MAWVFMRHPDTGGSALFPDEPGVIDAQKARGWETDETPDELNPDAPNLDAPVSEPAEPAKKATAAKKASTKESE